MRGLSLVVLIVGCWLGWFIQRARTEGAAAAAIAARDDCSVAWSWEWDGAYGSDARFGPPTGWRRWVHDHVGPEFAGYVTAVGLHGPLIDDELLVHVAKLRNLQTVQIEECDSLTDNALARLETMRGLKELWIDSSGVEGPGLVHLARLERLEFLELHCEGMDGDALRHLSRLHSLEILVLDSVKLEPDSLEPLSYLLRLKDLSLTAPTDSILRPLREMRSIESLHIRDGAMTATGLEPIRGWDRLQHLFLRNLAHLGQGPYDFLDALVSLRSLDLDYSVVSENLVKRIALLPSLENLVLFRTNVGDAGMEQLASCRALRRLDIGGTNVTDDGLLRLAGIKSLEEVHANGTSVTAAGVARLQAILPSVRVTQGGGVPY